MARSGRDKPSNTKSIRCAIYTRKSSEEGLEQDFNSLHAQREACEAYIISQKHEGWSCLKGHYDDGGISGATMERPALQQLLSDINAGNVDVVVVYKVDRLTRALSDFAKMVDTFDAHDVSFVSVTQQFNTTSSMGRLTLNVLLSFAQFEREVTGERIRDKIAASKKKGMWMGGLVPLGYDTKDRNLVVNKAEAKTVRYIFERYVELGSVSGLKVELEADGIVSKKRENPSGRFTGGRPIARGALYLMLQNCIYIGRIVHKDKTYPGKHTAIVDQTLWDTAQTLLADNRVNRKTQSGARNPSLLTGLVYDAQGRRLTPSHAVKNGKRYRYYISQALTKESSTAVSNGIRIPAGELEKIVTQRIRTFLSDDGEVVNAIRTIGDAAPAQKEIVERAKCLANEWDTLPPPRTRAILHALITRIDVLPNTVDIRIPPKCILNVVRREERKLRSAQDCPDDADLATLSVATRLKRAGIQMSMVVDAPDSKGKGKPDPGLVKLIVRAHMLRDKLLNGDGSQLGTVAEREGVSGSYFTRIVRLAFLSPEITKAILDGHHPPDLTAIKLMKASRLPHDWQLQREALGFA
jgi:site-specific DNA recombinase